MLSPGRQPRPTNNRCDRYRRWSISHFLSIRSISRGNSDKRWHWVVEVLQSWSGKAQMQIIHYQTHDCALCIWQFIVCCMLCYALAIFHNYFNGSCFPATCFNHDLNRKSIVDIKVFQNPVEKQPKLKWFIFTNMTAHAHKCYITFAARFAILWTLSPRFCWQLYS